MCCSVKRKQEGLRLLIGGRQRFELYAWGNGNKDLIACSAEFLSFMFWCNHLRDT